MIYVEMFGRLGNQFFRYAAARACQLECYPQEKLCLNFQQVNDAGKNDPTFYNVLNDFNVATYSNYDKKGKVLFNESSLKQKIVCVPYILGMKKIMPEQMNKQVAYEKKWLNILENNGIYWFRRGSWNFKYSLEKNKFLSGCFEDSIYFNGIKNILFEEFTPKYPLLSKNKEFMEHILTTNSICLSVRRGDFEKNTNFKKLHSVCNKRYFEAAINIFKQKINMPIFFMFSDDIEWVKENIKTDCTTFYEDGTDPVWEKLRLMSACKHFIISNSTFSWWAQYLSKNKNKIVVSPNKWFNNDYISPLIEKDWIKISV